MEFNKSISQPHSSRFKCSTALAAAILDSKDNFPSSREVPLDGAEESKTRGPVRHLDTCLSLTAQIEKNHNLDFFPNLAIILI